MEGKSCGPQGCHLDFWRRSGRPEKRSLWRPCLNLWYGNQRCSGPHVTEEVIYTLTEAEYGNSELYLGSRWCGQHSAKAHINPESFSWVFNSLRSSSGTVATFSALLQFHRSVTGPSRTSGLLVKDVAGVSMPLVWGYHLFLLYGSKRNQSKQGWILTLQTGSLQLLMQHPRFMTIT